MIVMLVKSYGIWVSFFYRDEFNKNNLGLTILSNSGCKYFTCFVIQHYTSENRNDLDPVCYYFGMLIKCQELPRSKCYLNFTYFVTFYIFLLDFNSKGNCWYC